MLYGRAILLTFIMLTTPFMTRAECLSEKQISVITTPVITRDWKYANKNEERKKKRAQWKKGLFSTSKKNHEKIEIRKSKKFQAHKVITHTDHRSKLSLSCIGKIHHNQAQSISHAIDNYRVQLKVIENKIKRLKATEAQRLSQTSQKVKEEALLASRHAQTTKDRREMDYRCSRIHNNIEHPELIRLRQEATDLRFKIKMDCRKLNALRNNASHHYAKAGKNSYLRDVSIQLRDKAIIDGKLHKRTRMLMNESKTDWERKKEVEKLRKVAAKKRKQEREQNRIERRKARISRKKMKQQRTTHPKLLIVVQKKQA